MKKFSDFWVTLTTVATFFLIMAGASVTSTGSGLAVPDWPLSFGQFFPRMEGGVFFEHGHRMIAGTVGLMTFVMSWLLYKYESRRKVAYLGFVAAFLVCLQATLGGLTVLRGLPQMVSVAHAVTAQTFFCVMVSLWVLTSESWQSARHSLFSQIFPTKMLNLLSFTTILLFWQLLMGAIGRHGGHLYWFYSHAVNGVLVLLAVSACALYAGLRLSSIDPLRRNLQLLLVLVSAQVALGAVIFLPMLGLPMSVFGAIRPLMTVLHVGLGAGVLGLAWSQTLWAWRRNREFYLPSIAGRMPAEVA